jgi:hypothetical protein
MNIISKKSALNLAIVSALTLTGATSALAGSVVGGVLEINTLTNNFTPAFSIGSATAGASNDQTDTTIVSGQIDNNSPNGWKLTVVSANKGKLLMGGGGTGREILYTNVKLVTTSGTLGTGLTSPVGTKNIATGADGGGIIGTTYYSTGTAGLAAAATGTVGYLYALQISWASDLTLLSGNYTDTITLTLADNDS